MINKEPRRQYYSRRSFPFPIRLNTQLGPFQFGSNAPNGNPISSLGAGGPFSVYDVVFKGITLSNSTGTSPDWTSTTLPLGAVIVGFFDEGGTGSCTTGTGTGTGTCIKTANSEALLITPLPGALPLFATGLVGLGLLGWRRKRKAQAV